ncbi:Uncharacterised protein [Vibrio cholerae]|nr:Uncharacterised protein [Vibrio cholerae]
MMGPGELSLTPIATANNTGLIKSKIKLLSTRSSKRFTQLSKPLKGVSKMLNALTSPIVYQRECSKLKVKKSGTM